MLLNSSRSKLVSGEVKNPTKNDGSLEQQIDHGEENEPPIPDEE